MIIIIKRFQIAIVKNIGKERSYVHCIPDLCQLPKVVPVDHKVIIEGPCLLHSSDPNMRVRIKTTSTRRISQAQEMIEVLKAENEQLQNDLNRVTADQYRIDMLNKLVKELTNEKLIDMKIIRELRDRNKDLQNDLNRVTADLLYQRIYPKQDH